MARVIWDVQDMVRTTITISLHLFLLCLPSDNVKHEHQRGSLINKSEIRSALVTFALDPHVVDGIVDSVRWRWTLD